MLPLRVSLQGFLSYKEKQSINFAGSSLWMLWGPNGVGKSALFDAITFALYNVHRAVVGKSNNLHELMNHHSDRLIVVFDFAMNGELYRVRRTGVRGKGQTVRLTREAFHLQGDDLTDLDLLPAKPIPDTDSETGFQNWVHNTIGLNYEAFTSSVLLLQGKSERLLEADPEKRYKTLAELIDLSAYQQLHLAADDCRRRAKGSVETLTKQIQGVPLINDETIALHQSQAEMKRTALIEARQEVEHLTALLPQAEQWETVTYQLSVQQEKLRSTLDLLERSREIRDKFARFKLLNQVLPGLTQILSQRERLKQKEGEITVLEIELLQCQRAFSQARATKAAMESQIEELVCTLADLNLQKSQAQDRLRVLAPLVKDLEYIEQRRVELAQIEDDFVHFPSDLAQQVAAKELQLKQLDEKVQVLPWLKSFAQARAEFATALKEEALISTKLEELGKKCQQCQEQYDRKKKELSDVDREERTLHEQKLLASRNYNEVVQRLRDFSKATLQPVCSLCGQSIDPEHAATEKKRLQDVVEDVKGILQQLNKSHQEMGVRRQHLLDEYAVLEQQMNGITTEYQGQNILKQKTDVRVEQYVKQIQTAFTNISAPFQQAISLVVPVQDQDWLATYYPSRGDLETLQQDVESLAAQKRRFEDLREQEKQVQALLQRRGIVEQQLAQILASTNIDEAESARIEEQTIDKTLDSLTLNIAQQQRIQESIRLDLREAEEACNEFSANLQQCNTQLEKGKAACGAINETIQQAIHAIPPDWQERAKSLEVDELACLRRECDELAPYRDLSQQQALAGYSKEMHEQRQGFSKVRGG